MLNLGFGFFPRELNLTSTFIPSTLDSKMTMTRKRISGPKFRVTTTPFPFPSPFDDDDDLDYNNEVGAGAGGNPASIDRAMDADSSLELTFPNYSKNNVSRILLEWTTQSMVNMTTHAMSSMSTTTTSPLAPSLSNNNSTNSSEILMRGQSQHQNQSQGQGQDTSGVGDGRAIWVDGEFQEEVELPGYLWITAFIFLLVIFAVGTIGNTMVIIVINCSRDMRTSTNIFLVNLSLADLLVLLICTPTCFIEILVDPNDWILGSFMCKLVPLLEATVANVSVLTILSISFERYYAICCPLQANFICTKTRAFSACVTTWIAGFTITSPMYFMTNYYIDSNNKKPHCEVTAGSFWPDFYTISSIVLFFLLPLLILIVTYGLIAHKLTTDRCRLNKNDQKQNLRARKQVVIMLGTVVFTFFLCLLPFRVLTVLIVLSDQSPFENQEYYYIILYFCRIMLYTNSSLNPILYNIMSSKFRSGFLILCSSRRRKLSRFKRQGTFMTTTTTTTTNNNTTSSLIPIIPACFHTTAIALPSDEDSMSMSVEDEKSGDSLSIGRSIHGHSTPRLAIRFNNGPVASYQLHNNGRTTTIKHSPSPTSAAFGEIESYYSTTSNGKCRPSCNCHCHSNLLVGKKATLLTTTTNVNSGGSGKCRFFCSNRHFSGRSGNGHTENVVEKCFTLNCHRKGGKQRQIIQAATGKRTRDMSGEAGKLTIKMAMKTNYYSCSFASFSNTNTLETVL